MQAVIAARFVVQQQRSRFCLSSRMALRQERSEQIGKALWYFQNLIPIVRHSRQARIDALAQLHDYRWQGICEVLVIALTKAITRHHDAAAEQALVGIQL